MTRRKIEYWVIPPQADGQIVAGMEQVLETYAEPYDTRAASIMSTSGPARRASSCSASH